jgi:hypothetical protein
MTLCPTKRFTPAAAASFWAGLAVESVLRFAGLQPALNQAFVHAG